MLLIRRVSGASMVPALNPDSIVIAVKRLRRLRRPSYKVGDIVIISHDGMEKIKRIVDMRISNNLNEKVEEIFVTGDNAPMSTDSRHFGWLPITVVKGKLLWLARSRRQEKPNR